MLVSGLGELQPGTVNNIALNRMSLVPGDTIKFDFFEKHYQLIATGNTDKQGNVKNYKIFLNQEGKHQLIGESDFLDDTTFSVLWAGDLDGDQELDLVMDNSYKYSFGLFTLFMSSKKQAGELLHLTAQHRMYYD